MQLVRIGVFQKGIDHQLDVFRRADQVPGFVFRLDIHPVVTEMHHFPGTPAIEFAEVAVVGGMACFQRRTSRIKWIALASSAFICG